MSTVVDTVAIKMVVDASGVVDGIGATTKEINEATRIVNSMRTPLERLEEKERRLQELFAKGAVTDIPKYERALQEVANQKRQLTASTEKQVAAEKHALDLKRQFVEANARMIASDRQVILTQKEVIQQFSILGDLIRFHIVTRAIFAVTSGLHQMVNGVRQARQSLDEIGDVASRLGYSVTELQRLRIEADIADVSFESLTNGIERLLIRSAEAASGSRELQGVFSLLGISMQQLSQMSDAQKFYAVAEALAAIPDRAQRLNIISDIFGRGNTEIIAFIDHLSEMRGQAESTNAIMSEADINRISEADTSIKLLRHSLQGVFNVAAVQLSPVIKEIADELTAFLSGDVNSEGFRRVLIMIREDLMGIYMAAKDAATFVKTLYGILQESPIGTDPNDPYIQQRVASARAARDTERQSDFVRKRNLERFGIEDTSDKDVGELRQMEKDKRAADAAREREEAEQRYAAQAEVRFEDERRQLQERNILLNHGADALQNYREQQAGYSEEQKQYLAGLREENQALEARKFAEEQDMRLEKERVSEAEKIREANATAEEQAAARIQRARDLVLTGELSVSDYNKLVDREARALTKTQSTFELSPKAYGSQAAIASLFNRNMESDSERLESMKNSLLILAGTPPVEVSEVGAF